MLRAGKLRTGNRFFLMDGVGDRKIKNQSAKIKIVEPLRGEI